MKEYRKLSLDALKSELESLEKAHFEFRMKNAVRQLENTAQIPLTKHKIAQVKTAISEVQQRSVN